MFYYRRVISIIFKKIISENIFFRLAFDKAINNTNNTLNKLPEWWRGCTSVVSRIILDKLPVIVGMYCIKRMYFVTLPVSFNAIVRHHHTAASKLVQYNWPVLIFDLTCAKRTGRSDSIYSSSYYFLLSSRRRNHSVVNSEYYLETCTWMRLVKSRVLHTVFSAISFSSEWLCWQVDELKEERQMERASVTSRSRCQWMLKVFEIQW